MPYDPNFPADNALIESLPFRNQFGSIKSLIDAVPGLTDVVIDSVTTLNPGEPASATVTMVGTVLHLTLAIPRGDEGVQGAQGDTGAQGPPFANAIVDAVNTLPPGSAATVSVSFDGTNVHFTFGIPQGAEGLQGLPGEVTNAQLTTTISMAVEGTSTNTNAVATLDTAPSDPPSVADYEALRSKLNEVILNGRR